MYIVTQDSMVYRKYCSEKKPGQQRGCFNILHLGIAISDTEFTNRLQACGVRRVVN